MIDIDVNGTDYPVPSNAADTDWAAKQVAFEQALAAYLNEVGAPHLLEWDPIAPDFLNSWEDVGDPYDVAAHAIDPNTGLVYLRGAIMSGASGTAAFELNSALTPPKAVQFVTATNAGVALITVATSGLVTITQLLGSGVSTYTSLDGIVFSVTPTP